MNTCRHCKFYRYRNKQHICLAASDDGTPLNIIKNLPKLSICSEFKQDTP